MGQENEDRVMNNVIDLPVLTTLDLDPDRTLENLKGKLAGFVLAGYDLEGNEVFSGTFGDKREIVWLLERFKREMLEDDS